MIDWILKLFGVVALCEFKAECERTERWTERAFAAEDNAAKAGRELHRVINQSASLHAYYSDQKRRNADLKTERTTLRDSLADATKEHRDSLLREGAVEMEVAALQQSLDCQKEILAKNAAKAADWSSEIARLRSDQSTVTNEMWRLAKEKEDLEKANKGLKKALLSVKDELSALEKDIEDEVPRGTTREKRTNGDISYLRAKLVSRDKEIENLNIRVKHNAAAYHTSCMELKDVCKNRRALYTECGDKKNALKEISEISMRNI